MIQSDNGIIFLNTWYNIIFVKTGDNILLYLNGNLLLRLPYTEPFSISNANIYFGYNFVGFLDLVSIYCTNLNQAQVSAFNRFLNLRNFFFFFFFQFYNKISISI